jgi:hypothetical protein
VTSIGEVAFAHCSGITSITIPDSVTSIGGSAFSFCSGITSITIPDSVTSIGGSAFFFCSRLTSITIGNSETSLGAQAFSGCASLTVINYNATAAADFGEYNSIFSNTGTSGTGIRVNVGANVTKLPAYMFNYVSKITSVNFAAGSALTSIGNYAFWNCSGLTSITIPSSVTSIGASAFRDCTGLTEINYNATAVGDFTSTSNVFYNAGKSGAGITVNVGANVTKLPAYMFYVSDSSYRPKITSVNFAAGSALTSIGSYAFSGCTALTTINYRGTEAEWNLITKGGSWNNNCPAVIVYNYED